MSPLMAAGAALMTTFLIVRSAIKRSSIREGSFNWLTRMTAAFQINACGLILFSAGHSIEMLTRSEMPLDSTSFLGVVILGLSGATILAGCFLGWSNSARVVSMIREDRLQMTELDTQGYFRTQRIDLAGLCVIMILPLLALAWCAVEAQKAGLIAISL